MDDNIGPALPPGFKKANESLVKDNDVDDAYGPALPPGLLLANENLPSLHRLGPALPPHMVNMSTVTTDNDDGSDDHDGNDVIGPLPSMAAPANAKYDAAEEFTERMRMMEEAKHKEAELSKMPKGREEWMTSLPTLGLAQDIGVTARQFRTKAAPTQDESWTKAPTDTPTNPPGSNQEEKNRKRIYEVTRVKEKDSEISQKLDDFNKEKRQESLVEMHSKKLKKEKAKEKTLMESKGEKPARVPFSRDTDLQVNRFDEAQKKQMMKKAALLDTRFGHGSQKYE